MIKTNILIITIVSSFLFVQPCFSMFSCCMCGEEEKPLVSRPHAIATTPTLIPHTAPSIEEQIETITLLQKTQAKKYQEVQEQLEHAKNELEKQKQQALSQSTQSQPSMSTSSAHSAQSSILVDNEKSDKKQTRKIIEKGQIKVEIPKEFVEICNNNDYVKLSLKNNNLFDIILFNNYERAKTQHPYVEALDKGPEISKTMRSVSHRTDLFYKRLKKRVDRTEDIQITEDVINCLQKVVTQHIKTQENNIFVSYGRDTVQNTESVLFKIKDGALLVTQFINKQES